MQRDLDASPVPQGSFVGFGQLNGLLAHGARLDGGGFTPWPAAAQSRMASVLAHDAARTALDQPLHDGLGAEVSVANPHLPCLRLLNQSGCARALALVGILASHDVAHQRAVRVVHHQRVARQRRAPQSAQRSKPLLAGRQVVAIEHPQLPARQALPLRQGADQRRQTLGAALHQRTQHGGLGALHFGIQRPATLAVACPSCALPHAATVAVPA